MTERIIPVLREAGRAIMQVYADDERYETVWKKDHSPLTAADRKSNDIICSALQGLYPHIPIISEENQQVTYEVRARYNSFFLLDPLDGTREFIKRNDEFTINLAYLDNNKLTAGYVFVPVQQTLYYAERNEGAWRIDAQGSKTTLQSTPFHLLDPGIRVVASRSHRDKLTDRIIGMLHQPQIVSVGSALKFLKVATGEADFYPRLAPTMEWDTAAAQCILEEAGGSIIRFDDLLPVTYNKPELRSPYFLAMGALIDPEELYNLIQGIRV